MRIRLANWKIKTLNTKRVKINPKPQYQRTSVWSPSKKKLFIDSILRGYDVPKFYLRSTPNDPLYDYEITDGQQRMRSIWEFMSDNNDENYSLSEAIINNINTSKLFYSNLGGLKKYFNDYEINITIIDDATPEEIRSLFARLQMGEQLNQVELRHAMASNIGSAIISVVETHSFFSESKISVGRYKHQDYLDHAVTLVYYNSTSDVKAKNIREMYKALANSTSDIFQDYIRRSIDVLNWMEKINNLNKGVFKNKWAFIDVFWLLYKCLDNISNIDISTFVLHFRNFEQKRLNNHKTPEVLINDPASANFDKDMYDYIVAFKFSGNTRENITIRHNVIYKLFIDKSIILKQNK